MTSRLARNAGLTAMAALLVFLVGCPLSGAMAGAPEDIPGRHRILVAFRYDDYSLDSDLAISKQVFDLFHRHGLTLHVAVIPFSVSQTQASNDPPVCLPLDREHADFLMGYVNLGCLEISQHGYSHQRANAARRTPEPTEFRMLDPKEQAERIHQGQACLERMLGVRPDIFVPPFNSYDVNTVACLEQAGFSILSSSEKGPFPDSSLRFVPETAPITEVREGVMRARHSQETETYVVGIFHEFELKTDKADPRRAMISLGEIEALLDWLAAQPDVQCSTLKGIASEVRALDPPNLVQESKKYTGIMERLWPAFVLGNYPLPEYGYFPAWRDEQTQERASVSVRIVIVAGYYLAAAAFAALISAGAVRLAIKNALPKYMRAMILLAPACGTILLFLYKPDSGYKYISALAFLWGAALGAVGWGVGKSSAKTPIGEGGSKDPA